MKWVFVCLQPYKQTLLKNSKNHKLAPKFYGPYQVRKRVGQVAYALGIPNKGRIHDVFHVSCLKNKLGSTTHIQTEFPMLDDEGKLVLEPKFILELKPKHFTPNQSRNTLSSGETYQMMKLHGRMNIFIHATHPYQYFVDKVFKRGMTCNKTK